MISDDVLNQVAFGFVERGASCGELCTPGEVRAKLAPVFLELDTLELQERTPIRQQTPRLGSCTACSWSSALEHILNRDSPAGEAPKVLSALAAYQLAVELEGFPKQDVGSRLSTLGRVVERLGVPPEHVHPYDPDKFLEGLPLRAREAAYDLRGTQHYAIMLAGHAALDLIEDALRSDLKVPWGYGVGPEYTKAFAWGAGYDGQAFKPPTNVVGRHCSLLVGVRNLGQGNLREWKVQNSWGTAWGHGGYAWVTSDYVLQWGNEIRLPTSAPRL